MTAFSIRLTPTRQIMRLAYTWLVPVTPITQQSQSALFSPISILRMPGPKAKSVGGREVGMMRQIALARFQARQTSKPNATMNRIAQSTWLQWALVFANLPGIVLFLYFGSWVWAPRGQEGLYYDAGDSIAWGLLAFPFFLVCNFINLLLSRTIFTRLLLYHNWRPFILWIIFIVVWFSVFRYNSGRHFDGSRVTSQQSLNP